MTNRDIRAYGYVNGTAVYSRDEYIFTKRGFGAITRDDVLLEYAKKVTSNWYYAGWNRTFETFYLGDYALDEPKRSLTDAEYARLKEMQKGRRAEQERIEAEKEWKKTGEYYFADNSVEEEWTNKHGETKRIMTVGPHGDVC